MRLARDAGLVAGVDFGHSHVAVALGDLTGHLLAEERRGLTAGHDHAEALELAGSMLDAMARVHGPVRHVGLGLPAPVTDDVVRSSAIFPGWEDVDTRAVAEQRFGVPVHVENDANLGALAEHRHGVGRGHDSSVFVKISSGVGAGIIIDNQLFHGAGGTAGRDRPPHARRPGPPVPLRQPGLPGGLHLDRHRAGDDGRAAAAGRPRRDRGRGASRATSAPSGPSRTPGCTSAGGWPAS